MKKCLDNQLMQFEYIHVLQVSKGLKIYNITYTLFHFVLQTALDLN